MNIPIIMKPEHMEHHVGFAIENDYTWPRGMTKEEGWYFEGTEEDLVGLCIKKVRNIFS